jgi:hypothetical protein
MQGFSNSRVFRAVITQAGAADTTIVTPSAGQKVRVLQFYIRQSAAGTVRFESTQGGTALTGVMVTTTADLVVDSGFNPAGHFETVAGELLNLETGTAAGMGWITYQLIG